MTARTLSRRRRLLPAVLPATLLAIAQAAAPAGAQQVLLDESVRTESLTLLRDLRDEKAYYYLPNRPRLAVDAEGRPAFSFLRWVENVRSAEGDGSTAEGGGLLHLLVELDVDSKALSEARRELRRLKPGATIEGAVGFRSGSFALVLEDPENGELASQIVGVGKAPLLGGRAAVNVRLTRKGATLLWRAFQEQSSPPLGFTFFDMEVAGFRGPLGVTIVADLEEVYNHRSFSAGVAGRPGGVYLGAEIEAAFDDLRSSGAIREVWHGEDADFERLINETYRKLLLRLFTPVPEPADLSERLAELGAGESGGSLLDRALGLLEKNDGEDRDGDGGRELRAKALEKEAQELLEKAAETEREAAKRRSSIARAEAARSSTTASKTDGEKKTAKVPTKEQIGTAKKRVEQLDKKAKDLRARAAARRDEAKELRTAKEAPERDGDERAEEEGASIAALAAFRLRERSRQAKMEIRLDRYRQDTVFDRFDGTVGDVGRCADCFLQVNLDDPLYTQRLIPVYLDGLHLDDFARTVNFVTVALRKRHAGGDLTHDEVRIDRANFQESANRFQLLYGWKGDDDRHRWLEYDYRVVWSFVGGSRIEEPWRTSSDGAVALAPPLVRHRVGLAADPGALADAQVRAVSVRVHYPLGGVERVEQVTLLPERGENTGELELLLPAGESVFDYEIEWRLRGGRTLSSGRRTSRSSTLFLDELPPS